ncbi:hypothetical protein J3S89_13555 [Pinisolibacter sp. B13]|uniref:hypothetical protein n=1 Tax=Pinisolibacter aquiterrae TaxID=2815579 RepID=UPI001C3E1636|nr:hypothetical protein [Pinisolibacter aquiterrae]MBV5265075.1 hypothetical protein [Pinisolibacter aquiterrae]
MDAATRIVADYLRLEKKWLNGPDLSVATGSDVSLVAVNPADMQRYHLEVELGRAPLEIDNDADMKAWLQTRFFGSVREKALLMLAFSPSHLTRILVTRSCSDVCRSACEELGIEVWFFSDVVLELRNAARQRVGANDHDGRYLQLLFYPPKNAAVPR